VREILVMPDQRRLADTGFRSAICCRRSQAPATDTATAVRRPPAKSHGRHVAMQSGGAAAVAALPVILPDGESVSLSEIATVTLGEGRGLSIYFLTAEKPLKLLSTVSRGQSCRT